MTSIAIGVVLPDDDDELDWALARDTLIEASRVASTRVIALTRGPFDQGWLPPGCEHIDSPEDLEVSLAMLSDRANLVILLNPAFAPISVDDIQTAATRLATSSIMRLIGSASDGDWWMVATRWQGSGTGDLPHRERLSQDQLRDVLMRADAPMMSATRRALHEHGEIPASAPWELIEREDEIVTP